MFDFWLSFGWTLLITLATILADWIAGRLILLTRGVASIRKALEAGPGDPVSRIKEELQRIRARQIATLTWGADLAAVAIGLDLAVLGLWMSDHTMFSFFQRWNTQGQGQVIDRAIAVWLVLLLVHFILLLVSIILKHFHGDRVESVDSTQLADLFQSGWLGQNRWMVIGNTVGFLVLLSSFLIVSNSV